MPHWPHYDLQSACPPTGFFNACADWHGFVELQPAEPSAPRRKIHQLLPDPATDWSHDFHWQPPQEMLQPVGCYLLKSVELWCPGILMHHGEIVHDGSDPTTDYVRSFSTLTSFGTPTEHRIAGPALVADGWNYLTWGHWVVEYLPRFAIARALLGAAFDDLVVPLPHNLPGWALALLKIACNLKDAAILRYHPWHERLHFDRVVLPTYAFGSACTLHSFFAKFYASMRTPHAGPKLRLCVSRGDGKGLTSRNRPFPNREMFEAMAIERGYHVVRPERHSLSDQISLFSNAAVVLGEFGSAMHNTVWSGPDTIVGCLGFWNPIQLSIGAVLNQHNIYVTRGCKWPDAESPNFHLDIGEDSMCALFDKVDEVAAGIAP